MVDNFPNSIAQFESEHSHYSFELPRQMIPVFIYKIFRKETTHSHINNKTTERVFSFPFRTLNSSISVYVLSANSGDPDEMACIEPSLQYLLFAIQIQIFFFL